MNNEREELSLLKLVDTHATIFLSCRTLTFEAG